MNSHQRTGLFLAILTLTILAAVSDFRSHAQDFAFNKLAAPVPGVVGPTKINVAVFDAGPFTANMPATTIYAVQATAAGTYELACDGSVTVTAPTVFQLPSFQSTFTDSDTGIIANQTQGSNSSSQRFTGVFQVFNAAASSNIQVGTTSYQSVPAATMAYKVHCKLYFLGT